MELNEDEEVKAIEEQESDAKETKSKEELEREEEEKKAQEKQKMAYIRALKKADVYNTILKAHKEYLGDLPFKILEKNYISLMKEQPIKLYNQITGKVVCDKNGDAIIFRSLREVSTFKKKHMTTGNDILKPVAMDEQESELFKLRKAIGAMLNEGASKKELRKIIICSKCIPNSKKMLLEQLHLNGWFM